MLSPGENKVIQKGENMESFERGVSDSQEFSDDDSAIINRTPENFDFGFSSKGSSTHIF